MQEWNFGMPSLYFSYHLLIYHPMKQDTTIPLSSLPPEEILILESFSLLPGIPVPRDIWMPYMFHEIDQESALALLRELVQQGWLQEEENLAFLLPVESARIVREQRQPSWQHHDENITRFFLKIEPQQSEYTAEQIALLPLAESFATHTRNIPEKEEAALWSKIGEVYLQQNEPEKTLLTFEKALHLAQSAYEKDHPSMASFYDNMGLIYNALGKSDEAASLYRQALEIYKKSHGETSAHTAAAYHHLAGAYESRGEYGKAFLLYQKSLNINKAIYGEDGISTASTYQNMAYMYDRMGQLNRALPFYQKSLAILRKHLDHDHPIVLNIFINICQCQYKLTGSTCSFDEWMDQQCAFNEE